MEESKRDQQSSPQSDGSDEDQVTQSTNIENGTSDDAKKESALLHNIKTKGTNAVS